MINFSTMSSKDRQCNSQKKKDKMAMIYKTWFPLDIQLSKGEVGSHKPVSPSPHVCVCPKAGPRLPTSYFVGFFCVQVRGMFSFCWYWLIRWLSPFKLSFHGSNIQNKSFKYAKVVWSDQMTLYIFSTTYFVSISQVSVITFNIISQYQIDHAFTFKPWLWWTPQIRVG